MAIRNQEYTDLMNQSGRVSKERVKGLRDTKVFSYGKKKKTPRY